MPQIKSSDHRRTPATTRLHLATAHGSSKDVDEAAQRLIDQAILTRNEKLELIYIYYYLKSYLERNQQRRCSSLIGGKVTIDYHMVNNEVQGIRLKRMVGPTADPTFLPNLVQLPPFLATQIRHKRLSFPPWVPLLHNSLSITCAITLALATLLELISLLPGVNGHVAL